MHADDTVDWCFPYCIHTLWFTARQKSHNPNPTNTTAFLCALHITHPSSISLLFTEKHTKTPLPLLSWKGEAVTPSSKRKKNSSDSCSYRLRLSVGLLPMFFHGNTMLMCDLYGVIYSARPSKRDKRECNKDTGNFHKDFPLQRRTFITA